MEQTTQDLFTLSATTAAVGMGVVFVALFLLSAYMNLFKKLVTRFENNKKPPQPVKPAPVRTFSPAPDAAATPAVDREAEKVAAAVAVGLHLEGVSPQSDEQVAAAIGTALFLEERKLAGSSPGRQEPYGHLLHWGMAGRLQAHRQRHQSTLRAPGNTVRPG